MIDPNHFKKAFGSFSRGARKEHAKLVEGLLAQNEEIFKACGGVACLMRPEALPLILASDEVHVCSEAGVEMGEERADAYFAGGSVRVAKGLRIGGGKAISLPRVRMLDTGWLILTDRRLSFLGEMRVHEVDLRKELVGLHYGVTGMVVHKRGRQKAFHFETPKGMAAIMGPQIERLISLEAWAPTEAMGMPILAPFRADEPVILTDEEADIAIAEMSEDQLAVYDDVIESLSNGSLCEEDLDRELAGKPETRAFLRARMRQRGLVPR